MKTQKIEILDTTLRDGTQANAISYSLSDKIQIIDLLTSLGIDLIEGGMPSSNPLDMELFATSDNDRLTAFGSTAINGNFTALELLNQLKAKNIVIYGKANKCGIERVLSVSPEQYLDDIKNSLGYIKGKARLIFDAEHFFDGYISDSQYALRVLEAAIEGGADTLVLCDTNGGILPSKIAEITTDIVKKYGDRARIGIHAHNDSGLATANTLIAVESGATHIQGTLLGFGERTGNACLSTIIPNLELKYGIDTIGKERLKALTSACRSLADITNINHDPTLPYVGANAFRHKAGMHIDAMIKDPTSYQHVDPSAVGNDGSISVSLLSGRANILAKTVDIAKLCEGDAEKLLKGVKEKESEGFTFDGADASFNVFVKKTLGQYKPYFDLIDYRVISDETGMNSAIVKVSADNSVKLACGEGLGPVHAIDTALRNALISVYPIISKVTLIDYKVRVLSSVKATASSVRVVITSSDGINTWSNVGVSADIIEASYNALAESINYYLSLAKKF